MNTSLFDDFDAISPKQWKQKIQYELEGKDYNESLHYATLEGIHIKPFYTKADRDPKLQLPAPPQLWKNCVRITADDAKTANEKAHVVIQKGAESIHFIIPHTAVPPDQLLHGIPKTISVYIETSFLKPDYIKSLAKRIDQNDMNCYVLTDTIGTLCRTGSWHANAKTDAQNLAVLTSYVPPLHSCCAVDMSTYQNAGATMTQQLAYGLAHIHEYLHQFDVQQQLSSLRHMPIVFKVSVGSNYFFEIAKLRALRLLWRTLSLDYAIQKDCYIIATPSLRNKTILHANTNMIRTTVECMSAILGGADTICNQRYDILFRHDNDFALQRALHQLLILKHESDLDIKQQPADGSYYIESITKQLAENALQLFKDIEKSGGFLRQLTQGVLQKKIKESAEKEQSLYRDAHLILTGHTPSDIEKAKIPKIEKTLFPKTKKRKTNINPISFRRIAEKMERKTIKESDI